MNCLALIAFSLLAAPASPIRGVERWELVSNRGGIAVWTRDVPDSSVQEVRADMIVDATPEAVWTTLTNVSDHSHFLSDVLYARVTQRISKSERIEYHRYTNPQINVYNEMLDVTFTGDVESSTYYMHWRCIAGAMNAGIPRIGDCEGAWALEPTRDGRTHLVYFNQVESRDQIPGTIFNAAQVHDLPEMMRQLAKHVASAHIATVY